MPERWRARPLLLQEHAVWDGARPWPSFEAWCAAHPGTRCRAWVSSSLLVEFVAEPAERLADDEAVVAWARTQLRRYHGDAAAAWPVAAWRHGRRRGASALQRPLDGWQRAAAASRVRLAGVRPWWSVLLPRAVRTQPLLRQPRAELLLAEGAVLTAIGLQAGALQSVEVRRLDAPHAEALAEWCTDRESLPRVVAGYGLAGALPAGWPVLGALAGAGPAWGAR